MEPTIKVFQFTLFSIIILLIISCGDFLVEPDPKNTPENNFDILWEDFDRYYSHFEHRHINWDSLYTIYSIQVSENTTDKELFNIVSSMLDNFEDGHVNIYSPHGNYSYNGWWKPYPIYFNLAIIKSMYLGDEFKQSGNGNITYANISPDIGYFHISSFSSQFSVNHFMLIDKILSEYEDCSSIIIDVRNNGGGSTTNTEVIASRFADQKRLFAYTQYRNGVEHHDFSELREWYIEPKEKKQFTKPIVVLTNRRCFSSTETFILQMREFPHVTVIGDTSGGGAGNPLFRELPNRWTYRIPRWQMFTPNMINFEGVGLYPDISIQISEVDSTAGIDTQLEEAIKFLSQD